MERSACKRLPFGKPILRSPSANRTRLASPALNEICLQITRIEGDADDTYDRGLELLYQKAKGGDALEFIRGSEIYKHLEDTVDSLDDVADEIQGIVIEHV